MSLNFGKEGVIEVLTSLCSPLTPALLIIMSVFTFETHPAPCWVGSMAIVILDDVVMHQFVLQSRLSSI